MSDSRRFSAKRRYPIVLGVLAAALPLSPRPAVAQDVVLVSPETHAIILENPHVRVLAVRVAPGEKVGMHSHPPNVVYYLGDATIRLTRPDGRVEDRVVKAGTAVWSDATVHAVVNVGTTELLEVQVELTTPAQSPNQ
jgi:quercetin dioxygenase-like cupin family protein